MTANSEIQLESLVESFTFGFGRVEETLVMGGVGVKYPQRESLVYYSKQDIQNGTIKIH